MTDDQVRDVRDLTRKAGISAKTTKLTVGDPLLAELAPGERTFVEPPAKAPVTAAASTPGRGRSRGRGSSRPRVAATSGGSSSPRNSGGGTSVRAAGGSTQTRTVAKSTAARTGDSPSAARGGRRRRGPRKQAA